LPWLTRFKLSGLEGNVILCLLLFAHLESWKDGIAGGLVQTHHPDIPAFQYSNSFLGLIKNIIFYILS
jgi:hypothetical protein